MGSIEPSVWRAIGEWVYHFQTLIAGIAAVGAAGITIFFIRRQIDQVERHRQDDIKRKGRVLRAGLTFAASELSQYAKNCIYYLDHLKNEFDSREGRTRIKSEIICPTYPRDAVLALQQSIEPTDIEDAKSIAEIIESTQIQKSRLEELLPSINGDGPYGHNVVVTKHSFYGNIIDALGLYKRADTLFGYARREQDHIEPICDAIEAKNTLHVTMNISDEELFQAVDEIWPPLLFQLDNN